MLIKKIVCEIKKIFRFSILIQMLAVTLTDIVSILFAIILGNMTTEIIGGNNIKLENMVSFLLLFFTVCFLNPVILYLGNKIFLKKSIEGDEYLLNKVLNQNPTHILKYEPGNLSSKIIDNSIQLRWSISDIYVYSFEFAILIIISLFLARAIDVYYTAFVFFLVLLNWIKSEIISSILTKQKMSCMCKQQEMNNSLFESVRTYEFMHINKLIDIAQDKLLRLSNQLTKLLKRKEITDNIFGGINYLWENIVYIFIILFGLYLVEINHIQIGTVISMSYYYSILQKQFSNIDKVILAYKTKHEMENELEDLVNSPQDIGITKFESLVITPLKYNYTNFGFEFKQNVEIKKGDKVAIIGENGSGKTTLLYLLMGILDCQEGEILYNGEKIDKRKLRSIISYVDANSVLFRDTVGNYISANIFDIIRDKSAAQKYEVDKLMDYKEEFLSGGERKRVDFTRVVMEDRPLLIFDEPETFLDRKWKKEFIELLKDTKKTVMFTSHDPEFIEIVDSIIYI